MNNLIYQFWDNQHHTGRTNLAGVKASWKNIKSYANRIGAQHMVEENPPLLHNLHSAMYYGTFNPVYREEFHKYDNVLFLDSDVHAVEGLQENIFEGFNADIGICADPLQAKLRARTKVGLINRYQDELWAKSVEEKWKIKLTRTEEGFLKVYNSGVVLYSQNGMINAKKNFLPFAEYINYVLSIKGLLPFYVADQNYLHTTLFASKTNFVELDNGWNTLITYHEKNEKRIVYDRNANTKFIHTMGLIGSHHYTEKQLWNVANSSIEDWCKGCKNVTREIK